MRDYQKMLEQALAGKGEKATPGNSGIFGTGVIGRFPEKHPDPKGSMGSSGIFGTGITKRFSDNLPDEYREEWEERAAIMEFEGNLSRHDAEVQANIICLDKYRQRLWKTPK